MTTPGIPQGGPMPNAAIEILNSEIAERVKTLETNDLVSLLSGRASSLIAADDNQNQNQNGNSLRG